MLRQTARLGIWRDLKRPPWRQVPSFIEQQFSRLVFTIIVPLLIPMSVEAAAAPVCVVGFVAV